MFVRIEPVHMTEIELGLSRTPARVGFKKNAGQNNHFLITVLVGLDAVNAGDATLREEFSTSWSPKDVQRSAVRSREYSLVTSLAWITDLVDVYRKQIQKMPSVVSVPVSDRINRMDGRANRLTELASILGVPKDDHNLLMMLFAVKWRNTIIHSDADTRIGSILGSALLRSADHISEAHRGLDVARSIKSFECGDAPTFKEVASFISAGQLLVAALDSRAIAKMDVHEYAESTLSSYFAGEFDRNPQVFSQYWPGDATKSSQRLTSLLAQLGFTRGRSESNLAPSFLESLSTLTAGGARQRYSPRHES
jgi:hypothetical protein